MTRFVGRYDERHVPFCRTRVRGARRRGTAMYLIWIEGSHGYHLVERDPEDVVVVPRQLASARQQGVPHQPLRACKPEIILLCCVRRGARERDLGGEVGR